MDDRLISFQDMIFCLICGQLVTEISNFPFIRLLQIFKNSSRNPMRSIPLLKCITSSKRHTRRRPKNPMNHGGKSTQDGNMKLLHFHLTILSSNLLLWVFALRSSCLLSTKYFNVIQVERKKKKRNDEQSKKEPFILNA